MSLVVYDYNLAMKINLTQFRALLEEYHVPKEYIGELLNVLENGTAVEDRFLRALIHGADFSSTASWWPKHVTLENVFGVIHALHMLPQQARLRIRNRTWFGIEEYRINYLNAAVDILKGEEED
jgi:hypothetical protein